MCGLNVDSRPTEIMVIKNVMTGSQTQIYIILLKTECNTWHSAIIAHLPRESSSSRSLPRFFWFQGSSEKLVSTLYTKQIFDICNVVVICHYLNLQKSGLIRYRIEITHTIATIESDRYFSGHPYWMGSKFRGCQNNECDSFSTSRTYRQMSFCYSYLIKKTRPYQPFLVSATICQEMTGTTWQMQER